MTKPIPGYSRVQVAEWDSPVYDVIPIPGIPYLFSVEVGAVGLRGPGLPVLSFSCSNSRLQQWWEVSPKPLSAKERE